MCQNSKTHKQNWNFKDDKLFNRYFNVKPFSQEAKPLPGDLRPKLLENMTLIATKSKQNIEKALNAFLEISTQEVCMRI